MRTARRLTFTVHRSRLMSLLAEALEPVTMESVSHGDL